MSRTLDQAYLLLDAHQRADRRRRQALALAVRAALGDKDAVESLLGMGEG